MGEESLRRETGDMRREKKVIMKEKPHTPNPIPHTSTHQASLFLVFLSEDAAEKPVALQGFHAFINILGAFCCVTKGSL